MRTRMVLLLMLALALGAVAPAAAQGDCEGALPPRLVVGQVAFVAVGEGTGNNLRIEPGTAAAVSGVLSEGEAFEVVGGPLCAEGVWWWLVQRVGGDSGWTVEGAEDVYWLEPEGMPAEPIPAAEVESGRPLLAYVSTPMTEDALRPAAVNLASGASVPLGGLTTTETLRWSPDGTSIALVGADGELYVVSVPSGAAANITSTPEVRESWPTWSPDSRRLAYVADSGGNQDIFSQLLPDGEPINLTDHPAADGWPAWSPDGTRIAFASDRGGNMDIYVMSAADGANPVRLNTIPTVDTQPIWSPDGLYIAFMAERAEGGSVIYVVSADGATLTPVSPPSLTAHSPAWSPDSQRLAYVGEHEPGSGLEAVYVVARSGANPQRILDTPALVQGVTWIGGINRLVAALNVSGDYDLYTLDPASGAQMNITNTPQANEVWPQMQPGLVYNLVFQAEGSPPTPVVNPGQRDLLLIYDPVTPVFTLQNTSETPLDLTSLSFTGAGRTVQADIWAAYSASPLNEFRSLGCLMIWRFGLPDQPVPPECGDSRQAWVADNTYLFWTGESFTVNYYGAPVATCLAVGGRCEIDLP